MLVAVVKRCSKCDATKSIDDFGKDSSTPDGLTYHCRDCRNAKARIYCQTSGYYAKRHDAHREYKRNYYKRPEVVRRVRNQQLLKAFGITVEQYDALLAKQGGKCAICGKERASLFEKHMAVDHDHETGAIRGILCEGCNVGLGFFLDNVTLLKNAIRYINAHRKSAT
jgi:hypothetical protein